MDNSNNKDMENIKNLINNGNLSEAMSHISPEMIQNFTQMMNNKQNNNQTTNSNNSQNSNNASQTTNNQNFDFSNIDMATIMKITSALNANSNKNDPKANLLNSLKPYLRDDKKGKLDNYMNLLNMGKIAEVLKDVNFNKENNNGNV